jgi:hypothetical protein
MAIKTDNAASSLAVDSLSPEIRFHPGVGIRGFLLRLKNRTLFRPRVFPPKRFLSSVVFPIRTEGVGRLIPIPNLESGSKYM